jgi:hypothetical protein
LGNRPERLGSSHNKDILKMVKEPGAYNPSYSGGRDQENWGSKPALGKYFMRPYLKKHPSQKRADGVTQVVRAPT